MSNEQISENTTPVATKPAKKSGKKERSQEIEEREARESYGSLNRTFLNSNAESGDWMLLNSWKLREH